MAAGVTLAVLSIVLIAGLSGAWGGSLSLAAPRGGSAARSCGDVTSATNGSAIGTACATTGASPLYVQTSSWDGSWNDLEIHSVPCHNYTTAPTYSTNDPVTSNGSITGNLSVTAENYASCPTNVGEVEIELGFWTNLFTAWKSTGSTYNVTANFTWANNQTAGAYNNGTTCEQSGFAYTNASDAMWDSSIGASGYSAQKVLATTGFSSKCTASGGGHTSGTVSVWYTTTGYTVPLDSSLQARAAIWATVFVSEPYVAGETGHTYSGISFNHGAHPTGPITLTAIWVH